MIDNHMLKKAISWSKYELTLGCLEKAKHEVGALLVYSPYLRHRTGEEKKE